MKDPRNESISANQHWNNVGDEPPPENLAGWGDVPRRYFGRTEEIVSAMALGGASIAGANGITFMDNAWDYHDGRSEELMGEALRGRRHQVFLMTKVCTHGRDKKVALRQLDESLRRLQTDCIDLWQIHEVAYETDPEL